MAGDRVLGSGRHAARDRVGAGASILPALFTDDRAVLSAIAVPWWFLQPNYLLPVWSSRWTGCFSVPGMQPSCAPPRWSARSWVSLPWCGWRWRSAGVGGHLVGFDRVHPAEVGVRYLARLDRADGPCREVERDCARAHFTWARPRSMTEARLAAMSSPVAERIQARAASASNHSPVLVPASSMRW